jgi:HPt (histidine-containing phosphotransfer) domain-containing protein
MGTPHQVIDLTYIKDAASGNTIFIKEMIVIFLKQTPTYLSLLKEYREEGNWDEFKKILHKLKPTITMMGIKKGEAFVKEIELLVKGHIDLYKIESLLIKLENICIESYKELNNELLLKN